MISIDRGEGGGPKEKAKEMTERARSLQNERRRARCKGRLPSDFIPIVQTPIFDTKDVHALVFGKELLQVNLIDGPIIYVPIVDGPIIMACSQSRCAL